MFVLIIILTGPEQPVKAQTQQLVPVLTYTSAGKLFSVDLVNGSSTFKGSAPPAHSIVGPQNRLFWIEVEDSGFTVPQPFRIMQSAEDGTNKFVVLSSSTFYAKFPRFTTAAQILEMNQDASRILFSPCVHEPNIWYQCAIFALDLVTGVITDLSLDAGWVPVGIAPDEQRALSFIKLYRNPCPPTCGAYWPTVLFNRQPPLENSLTNAMPHDVDWLKDGRFVYSVGWSPDSDGNRIVLADRNGLTQKTLATNVEVDELALSSNQQQLAYLTRLTKELWIRDVDGNSTRKVATLPDDASDLVWRDNDGSSPQTGAVKGTVYHVVNGVKQPLPDVQVSVETALANLTAQTNPLGTYQLEIPSTKCTMTLRKPGYYTQIYRNIPIDWETTNELTHVLVSLSCLPTEVACSQEIVQLLPSILEVKLGAVGLIATAVSVANDMCETGNRWEAGDFLGSLLSAASIIVEPVEKVPALGDFIVEPIKAAVACVEGKFYDYVSRQCGGYLPCINDGLTRFGQYLRDKARLIVIIHQKKSVQSNMVDAAASNVQLHVYDKGGNHLGFQDGERELGIPGSVFFRLSDEYQMAIITNASDAYEVRIKGEQAATYDMTVVHPKGNTVSTQVDYKNLTALPNSLALLELAPDTANYTIRLDSDGNGSPDRTISPTTKTNVSFNTVHLPLIVRSSQ